MFNKKELHNEVDQVNAILTKSGFLEVEKGKTRLTGDYEALFSYLQRKGRISRELSSTLMDIYDHASSYSDEEFVRYAEKQLQSSPWAEADKSYVDAFLQVLHASHKYWSGKTGGPQQHVMHLCQVGTIGADTAGALYGMIAGPAWSIIEGGLFSAVAALNC